MLIQRIWKEEKVIENEELVPSDFRGIYQDIAENLGVEITKDIYKYYNGQQITFPIRLYSKKYVIKKLKEGDDCNLKELSRKLGYSERWLRSIKKNNDV